ncbi:membrane lipoprotein lipid attachment site-containing protein [Listeria marthii]|uniref:membrane lipoprotein lipid attachment site-containing protein n=1 Tax=Listeria marthii TaxID=529731 RepID=UPI00188884E4|nr:membrane lipoprotein lipid attachment site-containing protein [Listeria marthii]MBF2588866.1 membrane lipoprotein lipid attachment site-containing protein [Listeria marthii]
MKKLIVIISTLFLLSGCAPKKEDITFGLEKVSDNFSYGEVYEVTKKESEQVVLQMSNNQLFFGLHDTEKNSRDFSFYWVDLNNKIQKTKNITIPENVGKETDDFYIGKDGNADLKIRNETKLDTIGVITYSGDYLDFVKNDFLDKYHSNVEISDGKQITGFSDKNHKVGTEELVMWGNDGEVINKKAMADVVNDPKAGCDSMGFFNGYIYVFSRETQSIYQLTESGEFLHKYDLSTEISNEKLNYTVSSAFYYQPEINASIFFLNEGHGKKLYFDVKDGKVSPWDFTNPVYKDKFITIGSARINLGNNSQRENRVDSDKAFNSSLIYMSTEGDYYFLSNRNIAQENPKEESMYTRYLVKIEKEKQEAFFKEYGVE